MPIVSDSALAAISTLAWVALVGVIIGLFGREEGGAWSIAGGVARGVRDWSRGRRAAHTRTSSPFAGQLEPMHIAAGATPRPAAPPTATIEDRGDRPIR